MCNFLKRLDIYTKLPPTKALTEMIVKILVELISTLAVATKQIKQGRLSESILTAPLRCRLTQHLGAEKLGKKLFGDSDVEAVLRRLDRLTLEEARAATAQTLEVVYGLVENWRKVMSGEQILLSHVLFAKYLSRKRGNDPGHPEESRYFFFR